MSKISFYQVMNGEVIKFSCQLLEKCFKSNLKTFVQVKDDSIAEMLDRILWTFAQKSFIPHATDKDPLSAMQPIYISSASECKIDAKGLMLLGVERVDLKNFDRVMVMIDGLVQDEVSAASIFMDRVRSLGHEVEYYAQNKKGIWEKLQ